MKMIITQNVSANWCNARLVFNNKYNNINKKIWTRVISVHASNAMEKSKPLLFRMVKVL